ncbi:MAG: DUF721 domain-containing protein [Saprospiraceae bacterium]|nr:DUF721 domain-containing protein [Saprospiraceae bacterium]
MKKNDHSLKSLIREFSKRPAYRERLNQAKIRVFWDEEMGPTFNREVKQIYVKKRVLYLSVHSSVVRQELHMSREVILKRMNELLEEDYLKEVVVR